MTNKWFVLILALSFCIRLYLAIYTEGTYDVEIWKNHAEKISSIGMFQYYKDSYNTERQFNHPPVIGYAITCIYKISQAVNISFKSVLRIPFGLLDYFTAYFIFMHYRKNRFRRWFVSLYLLCPAVFILSSYHGNTDSLLGLFVVASLYFINKGDFLKGGICIGIGACVKWIIVIILPIYFFQNAISGKRFIWFQVFLQRFSLGISSFLFMILTQLHMLFLIIAVS